MRAKALRFGIFSGAFAGIFFLGPFLFIDPAQADYDLGEVIGYLTMFLSMTIVAFGIYSHRKHDLGGRIGFGPAMKLGLFITAISTIVFYLANVLLYEVIDPSFLTDFTKVYNERLLAENPGDPEIAQLVKDYRDNADLYTNGWVYGALMAATTLMMGIVITLVTSAVFAVIDREDKE